MSDLTIAEAQEKQPWTVPYSGDFDHARRYHLPYLHSTHCVLHAGKTVGKLAAVFEALDHTVDPMTDEQLQTVKDMAADLMTAALRFANLHGFSLADEFERRVVEKNGVGIRNGGDR